MFHVAYKTDVGKRRTNNQDAIKVNEALSLFVVADGMGGHQAGEVASQMTVEILERYIQEHLNVLTPETCIVEALVEANKRVYLKSLEVEDYRGMGTTCSVVLFKDDELHIGHVGDSRVYFIDDEIKQITRDHTLVDDLLHMGEISKEEAMVHPKRHVITRAIGTDPTVEVDYQTVEQTNLKKILICSDGLTETMNDKEIINMVNTHSIEDSVEKLIALANDRGGTDNISVVLLSNDGC
jgi:protein phosphatase